MNLKLKPSTFAYFGIVFVTIIPFLLSLPYERQREEDFVFIFLNAAIMFFPLYWVKHRVYLTTLFIFLGFPALFDLGHIFLYQGRITESIFFILFDTNPTESIEYLESNLNLGLIAITLLFMGTIIYLWSKLILKKSIVPTTKWWKFLLLWVLIPFAGKMATSNLDKTVEAYRRSSHLWSIVHYYQGYSRQMKAFTSFANSQQVKLKVDRLNEVSEDELHILVIGESTTRNKMGVYGYERNNTPYLSKLKDEITFFTHVKSTHPPGTMANLKKIMTLASTKNENEKLLSINLVNIMKSAGFKTYWISNQLILGQHDTITSVFAKQADKVSFTNTTDSTTYDEKTLPILDRYLQESAGKKFIVLHLLGTHMKYRHRFPKEFIRFDTNKGIRPREFHNDSKRQYINDYDNAIYYHDHILNEIFKRAKRFSGLATLTYLSDHGEEVYDQKDLHGHPGVNPTNNLYEIPFFIWSSRENQLSQYEENSYESDEFVHTYMDLLNLRSEFFDGSKSILSPKFLVKKRDIDN